MAKLKLTKPQWFLLADIVNGDGSASRDYRPAQRLVELGLAEWRSGGNWDSYWLDPTDAGRAAVQEQS